MQDFIQDFVLGGGSQSSVLTWRGYTHNYWDGGGGGGHAAQIKKKNFFSIDALRLILRYSGGTSSLF